MTPEDVKTLIEQGLPNAQVTINGEGCNLEAIVVSSAFEGLPMLKQHKLVYALVNHFIADGSLHALAIKSYTPAQWETAQPR